MDPLVLNLAHQLVEGLRAQLPATGFLLRGIEVEVGELIEVQTGELHAALTTELPGIEVKIRRTPGVLHCLDCGAEYPSDEHPCPVCGSGRAELIHGQELGISRAWGESTGLPA